MLTLVGKLRNKFILYRYRRHIRALIGRGLFLGMNVTIMPEVWIDTDYPYLISIGDNCSLSKGVRVLAHDATPYKFIGATRVGKVEIRENTFIGENVIILPGVTIGPNVLVAAGSIVNKDIGPNSCVAGNPARFYAKFDEYLATIKKQRDERPVFKYAELRTKDAEGDKNRQQLIDAAASGDAFVVAYQKRFPWTWNNTHGTDHKEA